MRNSERTYDENEDSGDVGTIKEQLDTLREDVKALGRVTKDATRDELSTVRDRSVEAVDEARDKAVDYEKTFEQKIRRNPLRSVLIAAGAGALIGMISRR